MHQLIQIVWIVDGFGREGIDGNAAIGGEKAIPQHGWQLFRGQWFCLIPSSNQGQTVIRTGQQCAQELLTASPCEFLVLVDLGKYGFQFAANFFHVLDKFGVTGGKGLLLGIIQ